ncbi:DedA family protein [Thioclava sp. BHET1]|uniref:Membrane protein n=1 Tax=Thioclava dalianensis TaxID=1185766 RepID=A0A074TGS4_9RHOB|nr:DedA family protein [Thioclava dalianensis]KEP70859.1 membrane protein [Thioclava dalianensis]TMV92637.1 DedA family protein [Thioclava sp. BHET1]SFN12583.1 membrane protein DedA, SNARE-associated domain [Thioclava dalianensis]
MIGLETLTALMAKNGLIVVAPIAVLEGPIVTVIAAWLASQNMFNVWAVAVVVILADVVGDLGLYALGRWGLHRLPSRWRTKLGLSRARLLRNGKHFRDKGVRTLLFGKWTHSAGAPVLVAAGVAKMNFMVFALTNLIASIPKSLLFVWLGYELGSYYGRIDGWLSRASLILLVLIVIGGAIWYYRRKRRHA